MLLSVLGLLAAGVAQVSAIKPGAPAANNEEQGSKLLEDLKNVPVGGSRLSRRTPTATWSPSGWNAFRWGMGPGDVADRLRAKGGDFRITAAEVLTGCSSTRNWKFMFTCFVFDDHALRVLDVEPSMDVQFIDDRLAAITLTFDPRTKKFFTAEEGERLFTQLRALFEKEYGPPSFEYTPPQPLRRDDGLASNMWSLEWKESRHFGSAERPPTRGFEVTLGGRFTTSPLLPGGRGDVDLQYAEEGHSDHFNGRARGEPAASESSKLRGVSP
jgi:hypothetical protein